MSRYFGILFVLLLMIFLISFNPKKFGFKTHSANAAVTETSSDTINIESVSFDKETIYTVCPMPSWLPLEIKEGFACSENQQKIKVSTKTSTITANGLTLYYTVSAGKIIGSGSDVIWDLSGNSPGRYSISVGAGKDNVISGKTITKYIDFEECYSCNPPCRCPYNFEIKGPTKAVKEGDSLVFSANVEFGDRIELLNYVWKVTGGEIIEGQKTNQILVKTNQKSAVKRIIVTIEVASRACSCGSLDAKSVVNINE